MSSEPASLPIEPRPFVIYRPPPSPQALRSESLRDIWADVRRFMARVAEPYADTGDKIVITAQRWSAESAKGKAQADYAWPAECTTADYEAAVRLAHARFGEPLHRMRADTLEQGGMEDMCAWHVPIDRADEVLDYLESVPTCTGGDVGAPVHAAYSLLFFLRDLETGVVIPGQGKDLYPMLSTLTVWLQRECFANFALILPFAEPDERTASYVVALQDLAPVWMDPRYFDHMVPAPDGSGFHRRRLPPEWIGRTTAGEPRLEASRSGITPAVVDLPSDAELSAEDRSLEHAAFQAHYLAVMRALREPTIATLVIHGGDAHYTVEEAARRLGMPFRMVRTVRLVPSLTIEEELRTIVAALDGRRSVLLVEIVSWTERDSNAAILSQMAHRVLLGVALPPGLRLVVSVDGEPSDAARAASERYDVARTEGFATRQQLEFLERRASQAGWRAVSIEVLPPPREEGDAAPDVAVIE